MSDDPMSFHEVQEGRRRSHGLKAALFFVVLFFGVIAWVLLAGGRRTTVIISAPVGSTLSVDGDAARPRLRPSADSEGDAELHFVRLSTGEHRVVVHTPDGQEAARVLNVTWRDRPLMLQANGGQLREMAPPP